MASRILIYAPALTQRVKYVLSLFFECLINTPFQITTDITEYKNYLGARLNYSGKPVEEDEVFIYSSGLLAATSIQPQNIEVTEWHGLKIFYQTQAGTIPFDIFSAAFYLVSRYEEYLPFTPDEHGRFRHTQSMAWKHDFLHLPMINLWAEKLKDILLQKFPQLEILEGTASYLPTLDIDAAYSHKGKGALITMGSYLRLLIKPDIKMLAHKSHVLSGKIKDENDTYDFQEKIFNSNNVKPIYFFLAGKYGRYDKNISPHSPEFARLVEKISQYADIGIHPSYSSESKPESVQKEIGNLENALHKKITKSRQHYLRVKFPATYRCLHQLGITDDYSMGYPSHYGFRASICTPFFFYDLQKEETMPVKVHSLITMDGTFKDFLNYSHEDSVATIKELMNVVKKCNGEYTDLWHNQNFRESEEYQPWRKLFEETISAHRQNI